MEVGTECSADKTRVQSQAVNNLIAAGVNKSDDINEAPDWGLIIGESYVQNYGQDRVATAQGKQGIWLLTFPDRENTGNLVNLIFYTGKIEPTQGKF